MDTTYSKQAKDEQSTDLMEHEHINKVSNFDIHRDTLMGKYQSLTYVPIHRDKTTLTRSECPKTPENAGHGYIERPENQNPAKLPSSIIKHRNQSNNVLSQTIPRSIAGDRIPLP